MVLDIEQFLDDCISSGRVVSDYLDKFEDEEIFKIEDILYRYNDTTAKRKIKALIKTKRF